MNRERHQNLRPADKKPNEKYGLVLGGGGSKGCYHVGVWQAFNEAGITFDALSGTSIGALVGIFYPGNRIETVTDFVMNMQPQEIAADLPVLPVTLKEKVLGSRTVLNFIIKYFDSKMDITPLREHFRMMFDYETFNESPVRYGCMAYNDTKKEARAFFKGEITAENAEEVVMASSACYPAFPKVTINGEEYMDGMYADNVPIDLLHALDPSLDWTVVVDLHDPGEPLPPSLTEDMFYLEPLINPGTALDFSTGHAMRMYNQGYLETRKQLGSLCGYLYTFENRDLPLIEIVENYLIRQTTQMHIVFPKIPDLDFHILKSALGYTPGRSSAAADPGYEFGRLVEALALLAKIDPVALYDYGDYLDQIVTQLDAIKSSYDGDEFRIVEFFSKMKREEIMVVLHRYLKKSGHFPSKVEAIKEQIPLSYTLAWIWYCLDALVESLHHVRAIHEGNDELEEELSRTPQTQTEDESSKTENSKDQKTNTDPASLASPSSEPAVLNAQDPDAYVRVMSCEKETEPENV